MSNRSGGFWTDKRVAELKRRWLTGESGGIIAAALGCSRGAVLGKLNRLGLLTQPLSAASRRRKRAQTLAMQSEKAARRWARYRQAYA